MAKIGFIGTGIMGKPMAQNLQKALQDALKGVSGLSTQELLAARYERLMSYGRFKEQPVS